MPELGEHGGIADANRSRLGRSTTEDSDLPEAGLKLGERVHAAGALRHGRCSHRDGSHKRKQCPAPGAVQPSHHQLQWPDAPAAGLRSFIPISRKKHLLAENGE
jgi:hypothetical protein